MTITNLAPVKLYFTGANRNENYCYAVKREIDNSLHHPLNTFPPSFIPLYITHSIFPLNMSWQILIVHFGKQGNSGVQESLIVIADEYVRMRIYTDPTSNSFILLLPHPASPNKHFPSLIY